MSTPTQDLKTKPFAFDYDAITVRRSSRCLKELAATYEIEDREARMEAQAGIIASTMVGWTADDILDMPASRFEKLNDEFTDALSGKVPNASVTNS